MRFEKTAIFGRVEYEVDIFADSTNALLIIHGDKKYRDDNEVAREYIVSAIKEVEQSPYFSISKYDHDEIKEVIEEDIKYLQSKIDKLKLASELNEIVNKVYKDNEVI